eukprot:8137336-Pyramimonas_sp.AAC.1
MCSRGVFAVQAILAGCTFVTTLLKVFPLDPLDVLADAFRFVRIFNVVDDITLCMAGKGKTVANGLGLA